MHELIREHAMAAWAEVAQGKANPLADSLCADETVLRYLSAGEARTLLNASGHTGDAPQRARAMALAVRSRTT